jgi:hypothetical protein
LREIEGLALLGTAGARERAKGLQVVLGTGASLFSCVPQDGDATTEGARGWHDVAGRWRSVRGESKPTRLASTSPCPSALDEARRGVMVCSRASKTLDFASQIASSGFAGLQQINSATVAEGDWRTRCCGSSIQGIGASQIFASVLLWPTLCSAA